jgi:signal transduction histidine kinase
VAIDENEQTPEREQTDESLRTERDKSDGAMLERRATLEKNEDEVVQRARDTADAVLSDARAKADQRLATDASRDTLTSLRAIEDEAVDDERATADESLARERVANARALARLLPLERDATDRHLLTERARSDDALENRDDFLGIVAHDVRNLLTGIVLTAEALADTAPAARIKRYVARMNRLIGDLVDVASIDAGRLAVTPAPDDFGALVAEAVDAFHVAAETKGITLVADETDAAIPWTFDRDRMLQVLANLITNSIKFTARGGTSRVRAARSGTELRVTVIDDGVGVPADMLEAIFERFWQVGKNDRRGLGLGLYISRCIVEAHGGTIRAESEVGKGSQFVVTLPAAP